MSSSADESRSYMWEGQDQAMAVLHRQSLRIDAASGLLGRISSYKRFFPSVSLVLVILLASWMGNANGGYFVGEWSLVAFFLAVLLLAISAVGMFSNAGSRWSVVASGLFTAYSLWTLLSILWSPNRGDAWIGAGQTLLYLLTFCAAVALVSLGASRRWVLTAATIGPAVIAAFTLEALTSQMEDLFYRNRLLGTVGYYNGEAAFLLVPFWAAMYLAGSRRVNPALRGLVLAGAVLCVSVAVLTQSRGAMVSMLVSVPVFFVFSGQRLRGLLALAPMVAGLLVLFPGLNDVYLASLRGGDPVAALDRVAPVVWQAALGAGLYGLMWGIVDRFWKPPAGAVHTTGAVVLGASMVVLLFCAFAFNERVGSPVAWGEQKWEAFKTDDRAGQDQSRYLSASGSGRYALWEVAWKDFEAHPLLGVGTHNFESTYYQLREPPHFHARQPHMLPLEVLSERGLVGGVLFFGFLAVCIAAGLVRRFGHLTIEGRAQVGALMAAVAYWLVHSSAEWFWQMPAVTMPAVVFLALMVAPWEQREMRISPWPARAICVGAGLLVIVAVAPLYVANSYLAQAETAANARAGLESVELAQKFNPADPSLPEREAELALALGDWTRVSDSYSRAIELNPDNYAPYYLLARFHEKRGEYDEALPLYRKASSLNPRDEAIEKRLNRLEAALADREIGGRHRQ